MSRDDPAKLQDHLVDVQLFGHGFHKGAPAASFWAEACALKGI
jgi:hypothetical protein